VLVTVSVRSLLQDELCDVTQHCRAVTVPLIPFPVQFGSVFQQKPRFRFSSVLVTYLFWGMLNLESTNAVSGNINFGLYIHI